MTVAGSPVTVGRSGEATLRLLHPTVSRKHATLVRTGGGFSVEDHDSRFGTFVNGSRVRSTGLLTGDRVQFGSATAYRVEADGLRLDSAAEGMSLDASGLSISVAGGLEPEQVLDRLLRHGVSGAWADLLVS